MEAKWKQPPHRGHSSDDHKADWRTRVMGHKLMASCIKTEGHRGRARDKLFRTCVDYNVIVGHRSTK